MKTKAEIFFIPIGLVLDNSYQDATIDALNTKGHQQEQLCYKVAYQVKQRKLVCKRGGYLITEAGLFLA